MFEHVKVGDRITRMLAGIPMHVIVTRVTDKLIICGSADGIVKGGDENDHEGWWFDRVTGAEIDEDLNWGPPPKHTGSFLLKETK